MYDLFGHIFILIIACFVIYEANLAKTILEKQFI